MRTDTLESVHRYSAHHRNLVLNSHQLVCFYCLSRFAPAEIDEWWDDEDAKRQPTAVCPYCGIDAVIPDAAEFVLTDELIRAMRSHYFWPIDD